MAARAFKVADGGELVIPASMRRELGVEVGDTVTVEVFEGELRVRSRAAALANARRMMRQLVPHGVNLADELIADRRADAAGE
jgi:bifunctional DNA-binding transcriptional regulator/antitoxin component of YhaV-PrlF toxin-antitoxin module